MNNEPNKNENKTNLNKKSILFITVLIVLGIITGIILSTFFIVEANHKIEDYNRGINEWNSYFENLSWNPYNWSNVNWWNATQPDMNNSNFNWPYNWSNDNINNSEYWNNSALNYDPYLKPVKSTQVILPSLGVFFVCIAIFLLIGLIFTYTKVYMHSKSRYILGLELVFGSFLVVSIFFVNILRHLYYASAVEFDYISGVLGFGIGGLGSMMIAVSFIAIIGFIILLYLSQE